MDLQDASDGDGTASDSEDDVSHVSSRSSSSGQSFKALQKELQAERLSRKVAEAEISDLKVSFSRLKSFTMEAVQQRDHVMRLKEEAESSQQDLLRKLNEAFQCKNDAFRQRDDALRLRDDAIRLRDEVSLLKDVAMHARNSGRSDVETATRLLVAAADSIAAKASSYKSFADNLPRSSLHTGIAAVAYGFTNRAEEIVDELLRHLDMASKDRDTIRQQMEQRHNRFVIEVSELETSIQMLKGNLMDQGAELAKWQALATENEQKYSEAEELLLKKLTLADQENHALTNALQLKESLLANVEVSIKHLSQLLFQTHETVANHAVAFFPTEILLDKIPPVSPSGEEPEEGINHCISRSKDITNLFSKLAMTWKEQIDLRKKALEDLEGTITRLIVEKKEITSFLESALAIKQEMLEAVSKVSLDSNSNLNTITKTKEARSDSVGLLVGQPGLFNNDLERGEFSNKGSALESELKKSKQETFELQQFLAAARGELEVLRVTSERQAKELVDKTVKIEDLENAQSLAQKTIEDLRSKLAAAGNDLLESNKAFTTEAEARLLLLEEVERLKEQVIISFVIQTAIAVGWQLLYLKM
ncbi:hypothetical protein GOP47_0002944 [Adiantum capillus-veneris]|uniref:Uncharacterized protein n=1 Tax=Adiantum capillus-veneris TaxID=13818 RepID=A0A9D4ZRE0_ADICA|nr:hypothetical protein GOP47_0002944 [Adiantum capillus-veneris]